MLYTEQASIHHNEWENVVMLCTNWATDVNFEKGHFVLKIYN